MGGAAATPHLGEISSPSLPALLTKRQEFATNERMYMQYSTLGTYTCFILQVRVNGLTAVDMKWEGKDTSTARLDVVPER